MTKRLADGRKDDSFHESAGESSRWSEALYYRGDSPSVCGAMNPPWLSPTATYSLPATGSNSKEFNLLCVCSGVDVVPERKARIADATGEEPDWDELLRLAQHHGVLPLVARSLRRYGRNLPPEVERSLQQADAENIRRSLWFAGELARILEHFKTKQLKSVPYKGPVLAESVYGDLALRQFSDLDLLISPTDFAAARQALAELDYQPSSVMIPALERFGLRKGYERSFDGRAGKHLVELQWALLPYFYAVDLRVGELFERARQASLSGCEALCLSPEDSLIALCLHAAKHLWTRLIWVCDIAESLRTQRIDDSLVVTRARELGILRMLGVSFWLAQHLLYADLPPAAREIVAHDRAVPILGQLFAERLARGTLYDFESVEYFLLFHRLRERRVDRWRYLWRLVWTPGVGDLAAVRLPEPLFPLYRLVRLARLLRKLI
jgi:hypothetical protein